MNGIGKFLVAYFLILTLAVSGCKQVDNDELEITNEFCLKTIKENEVILAMTIRDVGLSRNAMYRAVIKDSEKISSWRNNYLQKRTRENLLLYYDSVMNRFEKLYYFNTKVRKKISATREGLKLTDSLSVLKLIYWTLTAEQLVLEENARNAGSYCGFSKEIDSFTSGEVFSAKDTVLVSVGSIRFGDYKLDFSNVTCRNTTADVIVTPKITKTGPIYILQYVPKGVGHYTIDGNVNVVEHPGFGSELIMHNEFEVK